MKVDAGFAPRAVVIAQPSRGLEAYNALLTQIGFFNVELYGNYYILEDAISDGTITVPDISAWFISPDLPSGISVTEIIANIAKRIPYNDRSNTLFTLLIPVDNLETATSEDWHSTVSGLWTIGVRPFVFLYDDERILEENLQKLLLKWGLVALPSREDKVIRCSHPR